MQDRYVGDIGDFGKYALLNALAGDGLRLGVQWCLNRAEENNSDGKFVDYPKLRECSPELFDRLEAMVKGGARKVSVVAQSAVLPEGSIFFGEPVPVGGGTRYAAARSAWNQSALERLSSAEVVFFDPDNGICGNANGLWASPKHVHPIELRSYAERGQSLIIYQHQKRVNREAMVADALMAFEKMGCEAGWAFVFHSVSARVFYVIPSTKHRAMLWERTQRFKSSLWMRLGYFTLLENTIVANSVNAGVRLFQYLVDLANRGDAAGISYDRFLAYLEGAPDFRTLAGRNYLPSDTNRALHRAAEITALAGGRKTVRRGECCIEAGMDTFIWHKPKPFDRPQKAWANEEHKVPYSRMDWLDVFPDGKRRLLGEEELDTIP
ncbi:MAG: hypothetical protein U0R19_19050 [Bryobacteraceae bacterium]